jgi:outer membrane protein assembly factor BamB
VQQQQQAPPVNIVFSPGTVPTYTPPTIDLSSATKASAAGCGLWSVFTVVIILVSVGVPLYFAFQGADLFDDIGGTDSGSSTTSAGKGDYSPSSSEPPVLLPGEPSGPMSFVFVASHYNRETSDSENLVAKSDGVSPDPVWVSEPFDDDVYNAELAVDATKVYAVEDRQLVARNLGDGQEVWRATLSDTLNTSCRFCFGVIGGAVVVYQTDGTLSAFAAETGAPAWSREFGSSSASLAKVGDYLSYVDDTSDPARVVTVNPADGAEVMSFTPTCPDPEGFFDPDAISASDTLIPSATDTTLFLGFGTISPCWQRWDAVSGAQLWSTSVAEPTRVDSTDYWVQTDTALVVSGDYGLQSVDVNTGAVANIAAEEGYELQPLDQQGNLVFAWARDTKGTTTYELWGIDLTTGQKAWAFSVDEAVPAQPPFSPSSTVTSGSEAVTAHLDNGTIWVVTYAGETGDITVQGLDPTNGVAAGSSTVQTEAESIGTFLPAAWRGPQLLAVAGRDAVVIDASKGELTYALDGG